MPDVKAAQSPAALAHVPDPTSHIPHRWLRIAASLNPADLLFGPIFQKDVRIAGRKFWGFIGRGLYALAILGITGMVFWAIWGQLSDTTSSVQRIQRLQDLAPSLTFGTMWTQFILLSLAGPVLTGPAIADEKRARTLSALLTTPMTSAQLLGGKLAGRLVHIVILTLLATPTLLAARIFGGLDASVALQSAAISISTAVLGAALGLMFSIWNARGTTATVFGILTLALFQGGIPALDGMFAYWFRYQGYSFHMESLAACSPATLMFLTREVAIGMPSPSVSFDLFGLTISLGPMWLANTLYSLTLALLVALYSTAALRRTMVREGSRDAGAAPARKSRRARKRAKPPNPGETSDPSAPPTSDIPDPASDSEVLGSDRTVGANPVLWREIRQPTFGSRRRFLIAAALAVGGLAFLDFNFGIGEMGVQGSIVIVGAISIMLQCVFMTTGGFVGEREGRTWDVLLTTPLSPGEIVAGKLAGALRAQWFVPAVVLAHTALSVAAGVMRPVILVHLALILIGPTLLFTATGVFFSLIIRRGSAASICNLIFALLVWLAPWLVMALMLLVSNGAGMGRQSVFGQVADILAAFNPVWMVASAYEPALVSHPQYANRLYFFAETDNVQVGHFTFILCCVLLAYATVSVLFLWASIAGFKRWSGRTS